MTALKPLLLAISKSIWCAEGIAAGCYPKPVKLGPLWPARLILELAENGVAKAA